jgi:hypothetical protein
MAGWERFAVYIYNVVGDGSRLKFWHDIWCGTQPLRKLFPKIYSIALDKDASVRSYLEIVNAGGMRSWNICFL